MEIRRGGRGHSIPRTRPRPKREWCSPRQRVSNARAFKLRRTKKESQTNKDILSISDPGGKSSLSPQRLTSHGPGAEPALKNKCPSSCPSRQERVRNKKAGQMFVATAERTTVFASCFVFCSSSDSKQRRLNREFREETKQAKTINQKQVICDRWRRGTPRPTIRERNVLRQGVRRTTSQMPTCACLCERYNIISHWASSQNPRDEKTE